MSKISMLDTLITSMNLIFLIFLTYQVKYILTFFPNQNSPLIVDTSLFDIGKTSSALNFTLKKHQ